MSNQDEQAVILIVDDTPDNIDVLNGALRSNYQIRVALDGKCALRLARDHRPDLILLDIVMPGMDGYECCRLLKGDCQTRHIPVVFVTALGEIKDEEKGFEAGAIDFVTKPISPRIVQARVKTHFLIHNQNLAVARMTEDLRRAQVQLVQRLGRAAEYKDNETGLHVVRMSHYARILATALGMKEEDVDLIFHAAPLHDIGKLGIPDYILQKTDGLNEYEWNLMRLHPIYGANIIGDDDSTPIIRMARSIALTHHEKWDGTGYPYGLSGHEIPLEGRIVAMADVFDALTSTRPYKQAWTAHRAVEHIRMQRCHHFDPDLVDLLADVLPEITLVKNRYEETLASGEESHYTAACSQAGSFEGGFAGATPVIPPAAEMTSH